MALEEIHLTDGTVHKANVMLVAESILLIKEDGLFFLVNRDKVKDGRYCRTGKLDAVNNSEITEDLIPNDNGEVVIREGNIEV